MKTITTDTIGEAWIKACRYIFENGCCIKDYNQTLKESLHLFISIRNPSLEDKIIEQHGDREMIAWMVSNFLEQKRVPELKNGLSYGTRLFNYNGKDQVDWVVNKLREKPETKAATIPMIMPNEDNGYVPCVSALDFKIRDERLILTGMCRAIDFGKKVYANLIALHEVQNIVAEKLDVPTGELNMYNVSAHVYDKDYPEIEHIFKILGTEELGKAWNPKSR
jgi:thymidylate synthase